MNKKDCPHYIVSSNKLINNEEYITVCERTNSGVIKISTWKVVYGSINEDALKGARNWYYGVYLPLITKM